MFDARLPHLPDDWEVWAFTDAHGVTSGLRRGLREAGLIDADDRWIAPARTALVGCGDYVDRGGDIAGMVALLRRLQTEAADKDGAVLLARGNHEVMPLMIRDGHHEWLETWLEYGGQATVAAFGCPDAADLGPDAVIEMLEACSPGLFEWFDSLPQAVRWRDVIFLHGGLAPGHGPADLGITTDEHLWVRSGFFDVPWGSGAFDAYVAAGIERVVFGHTPQWDGPTSYHDGRSLGIDTNAVGNPRMPEGAVQALTLLGISGSGAFEDARYVSVPTAAAPDTMRPEVSA